MKRVAIIGSPGTGKSTFAKQLAAKTGLPLLHLDYYYHDKQHDYQANKEAWTAKTTEMTQQKTWIIDGNFGRTMAHRLEQADTIFYFDMPAFLALKGVVKRWATAKHSKRSDMPDDWQEKPSWSFFWYVLRFRHKYVAGTRQLVEQNTDKVVVFKNHNQIAEYLKTGL
jgi:adenylate kinase family enzyme